MKFSVLSSGSKANCIYVQNDAGTDALLVDAGLSASAIAKALRQVGGKASALSGVLLTHRHADHAKHLESIWRRWRIKERPPDPGCHRLVWTSFSIPHDVPCVGFRIEDYTDQKRGGSAVMAIVLDSGEITVGARLATVGCSGLVVEANYDEELLMVSPYPRRLRARVSETHLSNQQVATFIEEHWDGLATTIVLAHLSDVNNTPEQALTVVAAALRKRDKIPANILSLSLEGVPTQLFRL